MQTEKSWKGGSEDGFWLKVQQRVCERKAVDELLQGWGRETKQGPNRGLGTTVFRGLPGEEKWLCGSLEFESGFKEPQMGIPVLLLISYVTWGEDYFIAQSLTFLVCKVEPLSPSSQNCCETFIRKDSESPAWLQHTAAAGSHWWKREGPWMGWCCWRHRARGFQGGKSGQLCHLLKRGRVRSGLKNALWI